MEQQPQKKHKKTSIRCIICNKKLRNNPFECRCGNLFCALHRLPESHKCTFDFKKQGIKQLSKQLIKVVPKKIEAI
jgi:predicted nucleic acid binding AN1-type Zn finger protein